MVGRIVRSGREVGNALRSLEAAGRAFVEPLERRTLMSAGVLDTTFNGTGKQTAKYRSNNDGVATAVQSDGKIIVVGDTEASGGTKDAFVSRYNADGSVDTSFANGGVAFLERGFDEIATGVAIQGDGKIVIVGVIGTLSALQGNAFIARYNPDGSADTTFNGTGSKTIDFGGGDEASAVAVTPQGRIIVAGTSLSGFSSGIAVAFLNPDGSFDTTFGPGTVVQAPGLGVFEAGTGLALSPTAGRFFVSGVSFDPSGGARFMVAEFNIDGSLTTAFGTQGRAFASFGRNVELATGVAVDPTSSKIVAAGTSANGVIEFAPGLPVSNLPSAAAATQADFAVARFNTDGTLDSSFGNDGRVTTDFKNNGVSDLDGASDVVVQSDGKVVASGGAQVTATGNSQFATARYTTNGTLDSTWGTGGRTITSFGASDGAFGMTLQADQKVVEVGHTKVNASNSSVAIVRYTSDGTSPGPVPTTVSVNNATVKEPASGTATANFTVSLSQANATAVTVDFATADGTATAGQDYTATSGTLTFAPGETTKTVPVQILTDTTAEGNETFSLNLSNASNATIATGTGTGTITEGQVLVPGLNVTKVTLATQPKKVVGGQPNAVVPVTVTLLNNTNAAIRLPVRLKLFGSTDQVADPSSDLKVGSSKPTVQIAAHKKINLTLSAKFPKVSSNQNLFVVVLAKGPAVSSSSGVQGSSDSTVRVLEAVTKLVGSTTPQPLRSLTYNQTVNVTSPLTNKGNVAANGTVRLAALISTDGTDDPDSVLLVSTLPSQAVHLNVGQTGQFQFRFRTPNSSSQLAPGTYTLLIKLTKAKVQGATNTTDGTTIAVVPFKIQ